MENNNEQQELAVSENQDSLNTDEELDLEIEQESEQEAEGSDTETNWEEKYKKSQAINKRLYTRYKKLKETKTSTKTEKPKDNSKTTEPSFLTREDLEREFLKEKGLSDDELDYLSTIAKGKGLSLKDAQKNPLWLAYKEQQEQAKRREEAQITKSRGYSRNLSEETKPNMTEEEHKKLWHKKMAT